ncbi:MAG: glycosyltransferase [Kaistella sp.]|nr:glycosyltransferase [Kaistella sp.]
MKTSVALCTYNGEKYLGIQLDSILSQTRPVDEIVVCDDGSTDATISILHSYKEKYPSVFRIYQNEKNLRSVKNFEKAISLCENDIIFLSDQDDEWLPEKAEKYCEFFDEHPEIDVLASNGYGMDDNNNLLNVYSVWDVPGFFKEKNIEVNYFDIIAYCGNIVTGATVALRKSFIPKILPFPVIKDFHHDEWIALNSTIDGKFHMFEEKYFKYRIHAEQQVGDVFVEKTEKQKKILIRHFDFSMKDQKFVSYKRILKRIISSMQKNKKLLTMEGYAKIAEKVEEDLMTKFHTSKKEMFRLYPVRSFMLSISDKILNKRKIK